MSNATKFPTSSELFLSQWSLKSNPAPKLDTGINSNDTTIKVSTPLKDNTGSIVTKPFLFGIKKANGWTETCLATSGTLDYDAQITNFTQYSILTGGTSGAKAFIVKDTDNGTTGTLNLLVISGTFQNNEIITDSTGGSATVNGTLTNSVSSDGLTISNIVRGIKPDGYDYTTGSSDFADSHDEKEPIFCVIPAVLPELIRSALQGLIATGGSDLIIGIDASGTITIKRSTGVGTSVGFLRWYATSNTTQFSNDGTTWTSISDATASVIFKVSATDTTPGYAKDKIIAGTGIVVTQTNVGGNETLVITTSLPDIIDAHEIYTPAYMTGGGSAETNIALWDSVSDGSFRVTIDGTAYNIDGLDFTALVTDMDDVAAVIQAGIRAATGSTETCVWVTDHFLITSADTTVASEVSVLSTSSGTVGTDISGAGAGTWMDSETGRGTATAAVLDPTADAGKLVKLNASGDIEDDSETGFIADTIARTALTLVKYKTLNAGETINGATLPVACYQNLSDNEIYACDGSDNTKLNFIGFAISNGADGNPINVQMNGIVSGFTGLSEGVFYYVQDDKTIGTTIGTYETQVGIAISETELLIMKGSWEYVGVDSSVSFGVSSYVSTMPSCARFAVLNIQSVLGANIVSRIEMIITRKGKTNQTVFEQYDATSGNRVGFSASLSGNNLTITRQNGSQTGTGTIYYYK